MFVENTTFVSYMILVAMETILAGNYEFISYQMCVFIKWPSTASNTIHVARVLNHILLERAGHQHSDKMCGVCITSLGV